MRILLCYIILSFIVTSAHSQLLKKVARDVKNEAEWKIRSKANQKVDQALDSLLAPKKESEKKKNSSGKTTTSPSNNQSSQQKVTVQSSSEKETGDEMNMGEGFIKLSVSANEVFTGGTVVVTGSSVKYDNLQKVIITTKGPQTNETETLALSADGSFLMAWQAEQPGEFTITATSSDGKAKQTAKITVLDIELTDWERSEEETDKAYKKLRMEVDRLQQSIGQKDKNDLEKRVDEIEEKVQVAKKLFSGLNNAMKELGALTKRGIPLTTEFRQNLSKLNDALAEQNKQMQMMNEAANHQPYDNTICEYLVMVNEACAAFSTFSNVWSKSVATILKNIVLDKGVPKGAEIANNNTKVLPPDYDVLAKQPAKIFTAARFDAESLSSKMGAAGFTGDLVQFASDFLMKKYCGVFKGELKHDYEIIYRNTALAPWWSYAYKTTAAVTFRYPKNNSGKIIKMKGNIEGNATSFTFFQDVENMDDFREQMKGRAKLTAIPLIKPLAVPFATSQRDELGFGVIARGIATPAYFNIPVDAEYDTDSETIKIFLNEALIDFTPMVKYTYGYIAIAGGIPLITRVDFPINKAKLTLNAVVSQNNELKVSRDARNNLVVKGSGTRQIGGASSSIEHKINFNLTAKNE